MADHRSAQGENELIEAVAKGWGVKLPPDFISVAGAYSYVLICEYHASAQRFEEGAIRRERSCR
jgi:hypothetical protein